MKTEVLNVYNCTFKINKNSSGLFNDFIELITRSKQGDLKMKYVNTILDNLYLLFKLIPELTPDNLPKDEEQLEKKDTDKVKNKVKSLDTP